MGGFLKRALLVVCFICFTCITCFVCSIQIWSRERGRPRGSPLLSAPLPPLRFNRCFLASPILFAEVDAYGRRTTQGVPTTRIRHPRFTRGGCFSCRLGSPFVPVGAGEGVCRVGTLASPSPCSRERMAPPPRATQASPLPIHPTPAPTTATIRPQKTSPCKPTPAPTGTKPLPRRCHTIPTRVWAGEAPI
jgi:hypothetical protein